MGGKSTSNSAVFAKSERHEAEAFDLRSWEGLTGVLQSGKNSIKDPRAYAEFRDLVLEYAQKGGDEELRKKIESIIRLFPRTNDVEAEKKAPALHVVHTAPVPEKNAPEAKVEEVSLQTADKKLDVIERRRVPSFIPRSLPEEASNDEVLVPEIEKPVEKAETVEIHVPVTAAVIEDVEEEKLSSAEVTPDTIVVAEEARIPQVTPEAVPPARSTIEVHKTIEEHKTRIAEIKRLVHDKVGNPAALMDTHNDAGKKYMMALLTALKATSAGSPVSIDTAMASLETAYAALVSDAAKVADAPKKEEIKAVPKAAPLPEASVTTAVSTPSMRHSPAEIIASLKVEQKKQEEKTEKAANVRPAPTPLKVVPRPEPAIPRAPIVPASAPQETPTASKDAVSVPETAMHVPPVAKVTEIPVPKKETEQTLHQSDLFTPDVSKALDGLLNEWKLFSGSGIFGIGPGGTEHPLYQTLAQLSMGEVLAGRWEKADAKAIRVIKEYVDAWRHEQGIAYTINETFEHYLRRVVQRILKRQNS